MNKIQLTTGVKSAKAANSKESIKQLCDENKGLGAGYTVTFDGEDLDGNLILLNNTQKLVTAQKDPRKNVVVMTTYDKNRFTESSIQIPTPEFINLRRFYSQIMGRD